MTLLVSSCLEACGRALVDRASVPRIAAPHGVVAGGVCWRWSQVWACVALKSAQKDQKRARKDKISPPWSATHTLMSLCGAVAALLGARRVVPGLGTAGLAPTRTLFSRDGGIEHASMLAC